MKKLLVCLALLLVYSLPSQGATIGPGDIAVTAGDGSFDLLAVDLNVPATLAAGTYVASQFNYQFTLIPGFPTVGTITPIVLTGGGTSFTPVAIGDTVPFTGPTGFISTPFGGSDTFVLSSSATVYPGLYWDGNGSMGEPRMPVGYTAGGSVFVRFQDANFPVVGTPISGGSSGNFDRLYDFSIEVNKATAVPEPSSLVLALTGLGLGGWVGVCRRRARSKNKA